MLKLKIYQSLLPIDFFLTLPKTGSKYVVSRNRLLGGTASIVLNSPPRDELSCLLNKLFDRLFG